MSRGKSITLPTHAAIELPIGLALIGAPFVLGLSVAASIVTVGLGFAVVALALQAQAVPGAQIPAGAHPAFDYLVAATALGAGLALGIGAAEWHATALLAGMSAAQLALTASTRFSAPLGAR